MNSTKKDENKRRLRKLKLASIKYKEAQLNLYIKKGYDEKIIVQTMKEIQELKKELRHISL